MNKKILCCDSCGEENTYAPIVEKPFRFAFEGKRFDLVSINNDGRQRDNYCLKCLNEEIEMTEECY